MMVELVYMSAARRRFDEGQLAVLLGEARGNNARLGVSGILLYDRGSFLQVLEGEESVVQTLFERIARDDRHERVSVLRRTSVDTRSFAAWTMGYVSLESGLRQQLAGRHALRSNGSMEGSESDVLAFLDQFREGRWRPYIQG